MQTCLKPKAPTFATLTTLLFFHDYRPAHNFCVISAKTTMIIFKPFRSTVNVSLAQTLKVLIKPRIIIIPEIVYALGFDK